MLDLLLLLLLLLYLVVIDEEEFLGLDVSKHGERASALDMHMDRSVYNGSIQGGSVYNASVRNGKKPGECDVPAVGPAEERLEVAA